MLTHRALADCTYALVFLTATPVQTSLENLFNLLRLLAPDEFSDYQVFQLQLEANRLIVEYANAIRNPEVSAADLAAYSQKLTANYWTAKLTVGEYFKSIVARTSRIASLDVTERIELQRDISELGLTNHIVSRTRKVDVIPDRPRRKASSLKVNLSPSEREFYDSVAREWRKLRPDLTGWGFTMAMLMVYRYTASCIPAARQLFRERADAAGLDSLLRETELVNEEDSSDEHISTVADSSNNNLAELLNSVAVSVAPIADSKFDRFRDALNEIWEDDEKSTRPHRKVIVFSYFKRTLRYLSTRLQELGIVHRKIDGDMKIAEREIQIDEFASDPEVRILLSSEVGAEGLDLQFASVIVNYDLPWNPMAVEQRIGRVDRIGQKSKTITILNLVAENTIEDRILLRLYGRIGIFEDAIGDIDPILGKTIENLTIEALRGSLSEEEQIRQVDETAETFRKQEVDATTLGREADALMAADQAFLDEVESLVGKRRVPGPGELYSFIHESLSKYHHGSSFPAAIIDSIAEVHLTASVGQDMRSTLEVDPDVTRVSRKIETGPFMATMDQQSALGHARAELIHSRHPLVRFGCSTELKNGISSRCFALRVILDPAVAPSLCEGLYAFAIWLFDLGGVRARTEIISFLVSLGDQRILEPTDAETVYLAMLDDGMDLDSGLDIPRDQIEHARHSLDRLADSARQTIYARESALDSARQLRRRATLEGTLRARELSALARLQQLKEKGAAEFAIRMAESKLLIAQTALATKLSEIELTPFSIEDEQIAVGIVNIQRSRVPQ